MNTIKLKGNWNQQKGKIKQIFSAVTEEDWFLDEQEDMLKKTVAVKKLIKKKPEETNSKNKKN